MNWNGTNYLEYARLKEITETQKPYRKTTNRYPLSYRNHTGKCFFVETGADGQPEYHIAYQHHRKNKYLTEAEMLEIKEKQGWFGTENSVDGDDRTEVTRYYVYEKIWNIIGVVRADNTFEFTQDYSLHQGTRYFLTQFFGKGKEQGVSHAGVVSSIRHGGACYFEYMPDGHHKGHPTWTKYKASMVIPLFKGQKIDLGSNRSVLNYQVQLPKVDRKRSKEVLSKYSEGLKFTQAMFKTMSSEVFCSELEDVFTEIYGEEGCPDRPTWPSYGVTDRALSWAKEQLDTDFFKSVYAYMMGNRIGNAWYVGRGESNNNYSQNYHPNSYYQQAVNQLKREFKKAHDTFKYKTIEQNEAYPSNAWGVKVLVDGSEAKVY